MNLQSSYFCDLDDITKPQAFLYLKKNMSELCLRSVSLTFIVSRVFWFLQKETGNMLNVCKMFINLQKTECACNIFLLRSFLFYSRRKGIYLGWKRKIRIIYQKQSSYRNTFFLLYFSNQGSHAIHLTLLTLNRCPFPRGVFQRNINNLITKD